MSQDPAALVTVEGDLVIATSHDGDSRVVLARCLTPAHAVRIAEALRLAASPALAEAEAVLESVLNGEVGTKSYTLRIVAARDALRALREGRQG